MLVSFMPEGCMSFTLESTIGLQLKLFKNDKSPILMVNGMDGLLVRLGNPPPFELAYGV